MITSEDDANLPLNPLPLDSNNDYPSYIISFSDKVQEELLKP